MISLFFCLSAFAQHWMPVSSNKIQNDTQYELRVFRQENKTTWLSEIRYRDQDKILGDNLTEVTLGGRYRLHENWKLGLFYRRSYGLLHNEDWVKGPGAWDWFWMDKTNIGEDQILPEVTYRTFLGPNVLELRGRYIYNFENQNETTWARASLTHFFFRNGASFINLSLRQEYFLPSNYGRSDINEQWTYLDALYHLDHIYKLGFFIAQGEQVWDDSDLYFQTSATHFTVTERSRIFGLNFLAYF